MSTPDTGAAGPTPFLQIFPKVALPMFLAMADQSVVAAALPEIAGALGAVEQISLVVVGYLIAATIAAPVYGRLSDSFGRQKLLLCALAIFMTASIVCAFAPNLSMLIVGRVLQGMGGGGLMALSHALIGETVEPRQRARYQGYLAVVAMTSNGLGPVMGGLFTEHFGWRSIFLYTLPITFVAMILIYRMPARTRPAGETFRFDYAGLLLFGVFVVSALFLLESLKRFQAADLATMAGLLLLALGSLYALIHLERRSASPLFPLNLLRDPTMWRSVSIAACHGATLVSLLTFVPIYLRVVHGTSPSATGLMLVPMTIGLAVGGLATGRIVSRTARTAIMPSWGLVFVVIGLVVIALFAPRFRAVELSASLGLMALFLGTVMSVVQVMVLSAAGPASIGAAAAAVQYSRSLGAGLGTALVALVLFATLASTDPEAGRLFGEVLQRGAVALDSLEPARSLVIQQEFAETFRAAFLAIAGFAAIAAVLAWTVPLRRL